MPVFSSSVYHGTEGPSSSVQHSKRKEQEIKDIQIGKMKSNCLYSKVVKMFLIENKGICKKSPTRINV